MSENDESLWEKCTSSQVLSSGSYGIAIDLGSTTVAGRLICLDTGDYLQEYTTTNRQVAFGTDILTRIFYCYENPAHLQQMQQAAVDSIAEACQTLAQRQGIVLSDCTSMTLAANTTMVHFLLGLDAFCLFSTPYEPQVKEPGFVSAQELGLPFDARLFIVPCKSNYLGGDVIAGIVHTGLYRSEAIDAFFDIGTNGELVIGNKEFMLCGAGAAGPALEGASVSTGMRAEPGAVDQVVIEDESIYARTIDNVAAKGICGSGIVDLLAQLLLNGWVDIRGTLIPEKSALIHFIEGNDEEGTQGEYAVRYAEGVDESGMPFGLDFTQSDIREIVATKAAAFTMVDIMLELCGFSLDDIDRFYVAGAFGKHVSKESAIAIGMYPDIERDRIVNVGNASLEGASDLLRNPGLIEDLPDILERMTYIQYGEIDTFLDAMTAAKALPHTDMSLFPTVAEKLGL